MWDPTECMYLSCILTLFCSIVLIFQWYSKTTEAYSYTKIKHSSCVLGTVGDLFLNRSSSLKWNPRELEPNISSDYPQDWDSTLLRYVGTHTPICILSFRRRREPTRLTLVIFTNWDSNLHRGAQWLSYCLCVPWRLRSSATLRSISRWLVTDVSGHAIGRIFKSQSTTAWPMVYMYLETLETTKPRCVTAQKSKDHKYSVAVAWNLNVSRAPKRLDVTSVITRVIKMKLLIGNVYPVTERSLGRYLCRAVSMAWSISVKCSGFHANICIYVVFPSNTHKKTRYWVPIR
jgi:hypothetical protein